MAKKIEVIARAIFIQDGHVLLTRKRGRDYTYLTGGHVERDESARRAIQREMAEEFDGRARVGEFVGSLENVFDNQGKHHHEINLVFRGRLLDPAYPELPRPREQDLEFLWQPVECLEEVNLQPHEMAAMIRSHGESFFLSTLEGPAEEAETT